MQKQALAQCYPIAYEQYHRNYEFRIKLRDLNFNKNNHQLHQTRHKNSQIKVIQKFIGKLKAENKNYEVILNEIDTLNLTKYLQEISVIIATSVNEKEVCFYSEIATKLNIEYEDFSSMIIKDLVKSFNTMFESAEDNKHKIKTILLFTAELFVCGFAFSYKEIIEMLKKLVKAGTKKKNHYSTEKEIRLFAYFYNCDSYAAFLINYSTIFTQATPKWLIQWQQENQQIKKYPDMVPTKARDQITTNFFANYISSCQTVIEASVELIKELEGQLRQNLRMTGQFNKETEDKYLELKEKIIFTKKNLQIIMSVMTPEVNLKAYESEIVEVEDIMKKYINKLDNVEIFQNEFQRELYEVIPNLVENEVKGNTDEKYKLFRQKLDSCKNASDADDIAKEFAEINNKKSRKMLTKDVLQYRKQYQLVTPYLCRVIAIVHASWKDIGEFINETLFADYQKLKENIATSFVVNDKKSRNLKYILEFTKFKIIDTDRAIQCIQNLIDELKGHNIELLISALESVGRFLYLSHNSANKFTFLLSKLENVLKQKSFPVFTTSQLINSINLLKPHVQQPKIFLQEKTGFVKSAEEILSKDINADLNQMITNMLELIKKKEGLSAIQNNIVKQIENHDFLGNYHYAYMLYELNVPEISDYITERTLETLENSIKSANLQSSLLWSRFLGELFKYDLVKRSFLYKNLSKMLKIEGYDLSVINMICTILETCQTYLDSKKTGSKNQKFLFLVDFKKFIHQCKYIPMLEEFKIIDVFDNLEPNLTSVKMDVLNAFLKEINQKATKEVDFSENFDTYLEKKNLKEVKANIEEEGVDPRNKAPQEVDLSMSPQKNSQFMKIQSGLFQNEYESFMKSNMRDYSDRIAKPAFVEKVIEKKKEKKKQGENEKKISVIARCGNKFVKKDVIYESKEEMKNRKEEKSERKSEEDPKLE